VFEFVRRIVADADRDAATGGIAAALAQLRKLSLSDFGKVLWSMPDPKFPNLSLALPRMASVQAQKNYTGQSGNDLLLNTLAFVRILENNYLRYTSKNLHNDTVLDFGVGYGRMVRLLYYFTDPDNIWGLDPMPEPHKLCAEAGLLGNFRQSELIPTSLPTDGRKFDLAYAFSVFTHLSPTAADPCLSAVRDVMNTGGLFMPTVWPPEMWQFQDQLRGTTIAPEMMRTFAETGFAYVPHDGAMGLTYGRSTIAFDFFRNKGWDLLGYDSTPTDPYQIVLILRKQ